MGKLPAFLFYPKDWRDDPELQMCSRPARSVWIDMLCLMFFAPVRGVCASGDGIPWQLEKIGAAIGGDVGTNVACIQELVSQGVASCNERGAIYSRRMVRDEQEREANRKRVAKSRAKAKNPSNGLCNDYVMGDVMPLSGTANGNSSSCIDSTNTQSLFTIESVRAERAPPEKKKFQPPSSEEVATYCAERKNSVDPQVWHGYYEANGWKVGRNPMKDWRAAVRYWESNGQKPRSQGDYDIHRELEKAKRNMAARGTG